MIEANPRRFIYATLIMMFFVVSGLGIMELFINDIPTIDPNSRYQDYNKTFNHLKDSTDEVGQLRSSIQGSSGNAGEEQFAALGILNTLIGSSWQTIKLLFTSFNFVYIIFNGLEYMWGVPYFIPLILGSFITTILAFGLYKLVFQTD